LHKDFFFLDFVFISKHMSISITTPLRHFLSPDFDLQRWEDVQPFYENLQQRPLETLGDLQRFCQDRSELERYLSEHFAWRYIRMTCHTNDAEAKAHFEDFVVNIQPHIAPYDDALNKKMLESPFLDQLTEPGYAVMLRGMRKSVEIFRAESIPLFTQIQQLSAEYQAIVGAMTVEWDGQTLTLQQAAQHLLSTDRLTRERAYGLMQQRRLLDRERVDGLFDQLLALRHQVATQADFGNFRDYTFASLKRFDYTPQDCFAFHEAVATTIVPLLNDMAQQRKNALAVSELRPWDKAVDTQQRPALRPFESSEELLQKTIACLDKLDPFLGDCLRTMKQMGRFDLESRVGKAPGGYNYPLEETGFPFIFMNASSLMQDVITMLHESGHAVHSILTKDLTINAFTHFPAEVAELASMSMELISMDGWEVFFDHSEDVKRAKIQHLEDILSTLPWVATVDKFQHWIYENPQHTPADREAAWLRIYAQFSDNLTDWQGLEDIRKYFWHKQLHIFELPFYYIEYGIAQLGAIGVWKNYKENPQKGLEAYLSALSMGYTQPIGQIYGRAQIAFDFSAEHIASLMAFVRNELAQLRG
jgi:oligoendopeptidase F